MDGTLSRARRALSRTPVILAGLLGWFVIAMVLTKVDVGPDWLDSAGYEHADAVVTATLASPALIAAAAFCTACLNRRRRAAPPSR